MKKEIRNIKGRRIKRRRSSTERNIVSHPGQQVKNLLTEKKKKRGIKLKEFELQNNF